jgi:hypothetical protein
MPNYSEMLRIIHVDPNAATSTPSSHAVIPFGWGI